MSKVKAAPSFIAKLIAQIPAVIADAAKLKDPAVATTFASGVIAVLVTVLGNVNLTTPEVAGWLALTGTVAAAAQKVLGSSTPAPTPAPLVPPAIK